MEKYVTLEDESLSLTALTSEERALLGKLKKRISEGISYLNLEQLYLDAVLSHAKRVGVPSKDTPLFKVCEDIAKRLGIQQGYLVRDEVVLRFAKEARSPVKELTTGQVAKMAACTPEAIRKAIRTGRLKARRVGTYSLIAEDDALTFSSTRMGKSIGSRG